jgi:uncharacterized membrane protein HdeD (DUF308 family)
MPGTAFFIIRGILGLLIGAVAFAWPGVTILTLVTIFAVFAVIDGVANVLIGVTRTEAHGRSWATALQGVIGIGAGCTAWVWPGMTAFVLVMFVGAWAIVTGVLEVVAAVRLRHVIRGEWMLASSGILSILFGMLVFAVPGAGLVGISWTLGAYAAVSGVVLIALGLRLRSLRTV